VGLDNLNAYYDPGLKNARLALLKNHANFRFHGADVADREAMQSLFRAERFARIVHLAAQAGVRYSTENPHLYVQSNITGQPIDVFNFGRHQRDFTYVDDIVQGVIGALDHVATADPAWISDTPNPSTSSAPYRIYNIGNQKPESLLRYIEVLEQCLGRRADKNLLPLQLGDVPDTWADVEALVHDVGYRPATALEVGVRRFVDWYLGYYKPA